MRNRDLRVLLIGATGVFGRLIVEQLAAEDGVFTILAGRTLRTLADLHVQYPKSTTPYRLDRDKITRKEIKSLGIDVVIDAAGPFQNSDTKVIDASIMAGCHYIDLADGRDFVSKIHKFNDCAAKRNVAALSGASATPAFSNAVLDHVTRDWQEIDSISVAICPGNKAPRGLSVVRGVFTYIGKSVRLFRGGKWTIAPGWGLTRFIKIPGLGTRLASLCETPDLDLFVERFKPKSEAIFYAGLELPPLHLGLVGFGLLVRWGLIRSLVPYARQMLDLSLRLQRFGSDDGSMIVEAKGIDGNGTNTSAKWTLIAKDSVGPQVPTLAGIALIRRLRDGTLDFKGAAPCVGILTLEDFMDDLDRLNIKTALEIG
mgnify:CR=1 FL=1